MWISNGILFNHESERRGENFVTKKITLGLVDWLKTGQPIHLGNLDAKRDWGYAPEYCDAMIKIIEHSEPDDFVVATGECHTNREFIEEACKYINVDIVWIGSGKEEIGLDNNTGNRIVVIDPKFFRPSEVDTLLGDPTKAKNILNWEPKVKFKELVKIMMEYDLKNESIM
jgi:GDPmannose 4,6-dehydratase